MLVRATAFVNAFDGRQFFKEERQAALAAEESDAPGLQAGDILNLIQLRERGRLDLGNIVG